MATTFGIPIPNPPAHEDSMELSSPSRSPQSKDIDIDIDYIGFDEDDTKDHNMDEDAAMFTIDNVEMTEADHELVDTTSTARNVKDENLIDYSDEEDNTARMKHDTANQQSNVPEEDLIDYSDEEDTTTQPQPAPIEDNTALATSVPETAASTTLPLTASASTASVSTASILATSASTTAIAPATSVIPASALEEEDLIDYDDEETIEPDSTGQDNEQYEEANTTSHTEANTDVEQHEKATNAADTEANLEVSLEADPELDIEEGATSKTHDDEDFIDYSDEEDHNAGASAQTDVTAQPHEQLAEAEEPLTEEAEELGDDLYDEEQEEELAVEQEQESHEEGTTSNEQQDLNDVEQPAVAEEQELDEEVEHVDNADQEEQQEEGVSVQDFEHEQHNDDGQDKTTTQDQGISSETQDSQRVLSQDETAGDQSGYITAIEENEEEPARAWELSNSKGSYSGVDLNQARVRPEQERRVEDGHFEINEDGDVVPTERLRAQHDHTLDGPGLTTAGLPVLGGLELPPTPTDTGIHPIVLEFESVKYPLFKSRTSIDGLLSDDNLINSSLSIILREIRQALNERIPRPMQPGNEMWLYIDGLSLSISEDSTAIHQHSMMDILDLYLDLHGNDGLAGAEIPALDISVTASIRLGSRIAMLRSAAERGIGSMAINALDEYRDGAWDGGIGGEEDDIQHIREEEEGVFELDLEASQVDGASTPAKRALDSDESHEAKRRRTS